MRVAFASKDGKHIDEHFGQCRSFSIFELNVEKYKWLESRTVYAEDETEEHESRVAHRVEAIGDCTLLFVCSIGNDAMKQLMKDGIMILKVEPESEVIPQMDRLLNLMRERPPLWLIKSLRRAGEWSE
ncbi:nitrogen fixation protein NifX [Paenibacillus sophorae]|uniref:Nitrogen fixation protein NifX n=1 Tax=Paenibacillus sophorae TaxID=1333845 RepID=A0A1H8UKK0_9BACL|nr:NifB/NifX family molybdenum-iron cluster-binding protein [Paenibacillus sophorae]QWU13274.1 nitrogen fixation protein NifX [Paenibacillus sophorae]SEP03503.1 nitrogen fixation protein NifX [Paenibacillus sophorae]